MLHRLYFSLLTVCLLGIITLPAVSAQNSIALFSGQVEFNQYDFSNLMANNQTEQVLLWSNHSSIFAQPQDQLSLTYQLVKTDSPLAVKVEYKTIDTPILGNKSTGFQIAISKSFTIRLLLVDSKITITTNWQTLLNTSVELDKVNYSSFDHDYIRREYQVLLSLSSTKSIWSEDAAIQYSASYSSRIKELNSSGFDIDYSKAKFQYQTVSTTTITKPLPLSFYSMILLFPVVIAYKKRCVV